MVKITTTIYLDELTTKAKNWLLGQLEKKGVDTDKLPLDYALGEMTVEVETPYLKSSK